MILNARQIHFDKKNTTTKVFPPIILLAIEDITDIMQIAETLASHTHKLEAKLAEQSEKLDSNIKKLQKEIDNLKKKK